MTEPKINKTTTKHRPRSKSFLSLDTKNAYTQLGVSPFESTDKIESIIEDLRGKAIRKAKAQATRNIDDEAEIVRLDKLFELIGTVEKRKRYDEKHPQNIMLTLQPSSTEEAWLRHRFDGLISEWLLEELEPEAVVPSFNCLKFWAPQNLEENLLVFLAQFINVESPADAQADVSYFGEGDSEVVLSLKDLEKLIEEK